MKDLHVIALGRQFVKRFPFAIGPLSVLSVTLVYCGHWPDGWMEQHATLYGGRPHPRTHCVRWGPGHPALQRTQRPPPPIFGLLWPNG